MASQREEVNCAPLSEVMTSGTPKRAIQWLNNAWAQAWAVVDDMGAASTHLVERSIIVKMWVWPLEMGWAWHAGVRAGEFCHAGTWRTPWSTV